MVKKKIKGDYRDSYVKNWHINEQGTYGIVGEDEEVIKVYGKLQTFRGKSAADNRCIELNRKSWVKLRVEKFK